MSIPAIPESFKIPQLPLRSSLIPQLPIAQPMQIPQVKHFKSPNFDGEVDRYFHDHLLPLKDKIMKMHYKLVITGCVGSGKTTIISNLYELFEEFNPVMIKEYLEANKTLGPLILSEFINGTISPLTTQNAILDIYENQLKGLKLEDHGIILYERIPDDNLTVFANLACKDNGLNDDEFKVLYSRTVDIDKKYGIPSYILRTAEFKKINSSDLIDTVSIILSIIHDDIINGVSSRIIGISVCLEACKLRVKRRGRTDEDKYQDDYLNGIIKTYDNIYNVIEKDDYNISLFNIGRFIE